MFPTNLPILPIDPYTVDGSYIELKRDSLSGWRAEVWDSGMHVDTFRQWGDRRGTNPSDLLMEANRQYPHAAFVPKD